MRVALDARPLCVCVCVCVCARACVRACVRACTYACMYLYVSPHTNRLSDTSRAHACITGEQDHNRGPYQHLCMYRMCSLTYRMCLLNYRMCSLATKAGKITIESLTSVSAYSCAQVPTRATVPRALRASMDRCSRPRRQMQRAHLALWARTLRQRVRHRTFSFVCMSVFTCKFMCHSCIHVI